uniref:F-box domain-containing protein n=1 Tax=Strongyloides papillosus TaxID=174720 RepID=A0A0N5BVB2_STREA
MDAKKKSFINIMEVGLVRKKILGYLPNFKDIFCLASTCWHLNQIINNEKIIRNILFERRALNMEFGCIGIRTSDSLRYIDVEEESKFIDYGFIERDDYFRGEVNRNEQSNRDILICNNTVEISFYNRESKVFERNRVSYIKKLAQHYNMRLKERKELTTLRIHHQDFNTFISMYFPHTLPYLHHENINTIIIPISYLSTSISTNNGFLNNLFDGFPKLYKIEIHIMHSRVNIEDFFRNKDAVDEIMKQLSKKNNATIHFQYFDLHCFLTECFLLFFTFAMKYGIKVTLCDETLYRLEYRYIYDALRVYNCPIQQCVTYCVGKFESLHFYSHDCYKRMIYYENLEKTVWEFNYSLYDCLLEQVFQVFGYRQSLRHLKKLVEVQLIFTRHYKDSINKIEIFHRNVKFLIQLLPKSVKRLRLYGVPKLTYDITRTIKRYMPNIEVLSLCNVSFEQNDCLIVFKKLQAVAIHKDIPVKIPDSVKLFAINPKEPTENDIGQRLNDEYLDKFSKKLTNNKGRTIYFNDVIDWCYHRDLLQMEDNFYIESA